MKIEFLYTFANAMTSSVVFKFLMLVVVLDTLLGVLRAIKYRNSTVLQVLMELFERWPCWSVRWL